MVDISLILVLTQISIFGITICFSWIFIFLILLIRRLRHIHNVFKLNVCLAYTGCNTFFIVFFTMSRFDAVDLFVEKYCLFLFYAYMVAPLQVPLTFLSFSFHRLFLIIYYTRAFFNRKRWAILCLMIQWILGFLIPIPFLLRDRPYCFLRYWMHVYSMVLIVLVPSSILLMMNFLIFLFVRSSTKRVQPQQFSVATITQSSSNQIQRSKLSRRDLRLLKQMVFMFLIFVGGWGPVYIFLLCNDLAAMVPLLLPICTALAAFSSLIVITNLLFNDYDVRQWFYEQYRRCFLL